MEDVHTMPASHAVKAKAWRETGGEAGQARAVADYVAGMTDRYALAAYARLVGRPPEIEMRAKLMKEDHD